MAEKKEGGGDKSRLGTRTYGKTSNPFIYKLKALPGNL